MTNEKLQHEINQMFKTWNKLKREYTLMNANQDTDKYFEHKSNFLDLILSTELKMRSVQSASRTEEYTTTKK